MPYTIDEIIKYCTVRLRSNDELGQVIGSGVLWRQEKEKTKEGKPEPPERIYLLTAEHCIKNAATNQIEESVKIEIYNPGTTGYDYIVILDLPNSCVIHKEAQQEIAVISIEASRVLAITPELPCVPIIQNHANCETYKCAGFPVGSNHEYDVVNAQWISGDEATHRETLKIEQTYTESSASGFSGGGIFCITHNEVILEGVMTKFRMEDYGGMLFGSDFQNLNFKLYSVHKPVIRFSYIVAEGITEKSIKEALKETYDNLGKRFIPSFNVDTNIQAKLDTVGRTPKYYQEFEDAINHWLTEEGYWHAEDGEIYAELKNVQGDVIQYAQNIRNYEEITLAPLEEKVQHILDKAESEDSELIKSYTKGNATYITNRREELFRVMRYCSSFLSLSKRFSVSLANKNFVIIHGEAGCGKSHLLGHFSQEVKDYDAQKNSQHNCPAILHLGGDFSTKKTIEDNILTLQKAECSFEELIAGLEQIGQRLGRRVPIMIDALNETKDMNYWVGKLPGFVRNISKYHHLCLIVSIRDTYMEDVLSRDYPAEWKDVMYLHDGFADDEFKAIKAFCEYYDLSPLKMPILDPEFANPLYLHIACQIAVKAHMDALPTGWQVYSLFDKYAQELDEDFAEDNSIYKRRRIVTKSIDVIAGKMLEMGKTHMSYDEYDTLIEEAFPRYVELSNDLIDSSLLSKGIDYIYSEDISFTYQRMGDYYVANALLQGCETKEDVKLRLEQYESMLLENYEFRGVLEQLFALIPERYDVEIWEVMDVSAINGRLMMLFYSLHWRSVKSIHEETILAFIKQNFREPEMWLRTLLFLAPIPNHPFNGDRWNAIMRHRPTMAARDAILQKFIYDTTRSEENYIQRLIDWAWTPGVSKEADAEVARLVSMTLVWMLSSTNHVLRNHTTKALVNLLQHQPKTLLKVLQAFEGVDDSYIYERLMAVAYGCVLRTEDKEEVCKIAKYVYKTLFKDGNPPKHILTRDYACNIVDYACKVCGLTGVKEQTYLPPYGAKIPKLPELKDVEKYKIDDDKRSIRYSFEQNLISHSLYGMLPDFGNKTVDPAINRFASWSFTKEEELRKMMKRSKKLERLLMEIYVEAKTQKVQFANIYQDAKGREMMHGMWDSIIEFSTKGIKEFLTEEEFERLDEELIPNHLARGNRYWHRRNTMPYRYWILQRVFELGYNKDIHGSYDRVVNGQGSYYIRQKQRGNVIETIGEKYQQIALYEMLGCLADNYYIDHPWNTSKEIPYDGAWEDFLRNINPVSITKREEDTESKWMDYEPRCDWYLPVNEWLAEGWTIEDVREVLLRTDAKGEQWFTMHDDSYCHPPKKIGTSAYHDDSFINFYVQTYFIRKEDKDRLIAMSGNVNFHEYEMASPVDSSIKYISREKYWSRACKIDEEQTTEIWSRLHNECDVEVIVPFVSVNGTCDDDCQLTDAWYAMPIHSLFEGMHMGYAETDGDYQIDGELCATCNPNRTRQFLMRKDVLLSYLESQGWEMIWIVNQQRIFNPDCSTHLNNKVWQHSGLFYLDTNGEIQGQFKIKDRDASEDTSDIYA